MDVKVKNRKIPFTFTPKKKKNRKKNLGTNLMRCLYAPYAENYILKKEIKKKNQNKCRELPCIGLEDSTL